MIGFIIACAAIAAFIIWAVLTFRRNEERKRREAEEGQV